MTILCSVLSSNVLVLTCFVMCGCLNNYVGVLVICVLVFTVFCIVCTVLLYCIIHVYFILLV